MARKIPAQFRRLAPGLGTFGCYLVVVVSFLMFDKCSTCLGGQVIDWLFNSWKTNRKALMVEQVLVARKTLLSKYVLVAVH